MYVAMWLYMYAYTEPMPMVTLNTYLWLALGNMYPEVM